MRRALTSLLQVRPPRQVAVGLAVLVLAYVALGIAFAVRTPSWQNPDEVSHFLYVETIVRDHGLPIVSLERAGYYEGIQPPLYYVFLAPLLWIVTAASPRTQLLTLRIATLLIGTLLIPLVYAIARRATQLFERPQAEDVGLLAAAVVAFMPQHVNGLASVSNDVAAELAASILILSVIRRLQANSVGSAAVEWGALLGLAAVAKLHAAAIGVVIVATGALILWRRHEWTIAEALRTLGVTGGIALAVVSPWFVRNLIEYGDPIVSGPHAAISNASGEPGWSDVRAPLTTFVGQAFRSFWVQLGPFFVRANGWVYRMLALTVVIAAAGLVMVLLRKRDYRLTAPIGVLAVTALTGVAWILIYCLTQTFQPQGRYAYPAIAAFATLLALGWCGLAPSRARTAAMVGAVALAALAVYVHVDVVPRIPTGRCLRFEGDRPIWTWPQRDATGSFPCGEAGSFISTQEDLPGARIARVETKREP